MREDIEAVETAQALGFKVLKSCNRSHLVRSDYHAGEPIPHNPLTFELGRVVVWTVRGGWRYAELIEGHYTNHSQVMNLHSCLTTASNVHRATIEEKTI